MNLPILSLERLDLWFEYADTYGRQGNTGRLYLVRKVQNKNRFSGVSQRIEELRG